MLRKSRRKPRKRALPRKKLPPMMNRRQRNRRRKPAKMRVNQLPIQKMKKKSIGKKLRQHVLRQRRSKLPSRRESKG
jgi:hypothetical protein